MPMLRATPSVAPLDPLERMAAAIQNPLDAQALREARDDLHAVTHSAQQAGRDDVAELTGMLVQLLEVVQCFVESPCDAEIPSGMLDLLHQGIQEVRATVLDDEDPGPRIRDLMAAAYDQWGDYLCLVDDSLATTAEASSSDPTRADGNGSCDLRLQEDLQAPCAEEVHALLAALAVSNKPVEREAEVVGEHGGKERPEADISDQMELEGELLEAYLDDARRCLGGIEAAVLEYEADDTNPQPLQHICRELHTLKGASASVGLAELASYLHEVEDRLQNHLPAKSPPADVQMLLECVDQVRQCIVDLSGEAGRRAPVVGEAPSASEAKSVGAARSTSASHVAGALSSVPQAGASAALLPLVEESADPGEQSLRVRAAQLDRLLDMLAELVMLRNRRDSRVAQLKTIHGELLRCGSRLRVLDRGEELPANALPELASDVLEMARSLRDMYDPVTEENLAVSRFIRQFRQELMELRRVPAAGLFQRLQRAVRDAARGEGKQVRWEGIGEQARLDRSLLERLYEPLLHMARNAVSHGIEDPSQRLASGKDPVGTVALEIRGSANALVVELRDNGRGLDYEALRRRGLQLGLLPGDRAVSRDELAQLIFHPGFSTRQTVDELSGRGVGMDVVASTLERLRGWLEVESTPGQGTCVRMTIPLHSVIEHVMVFRSGGQLFGLPMPLVQQVGEPLGERAERSGREGQPTAEVTSAIPFACLFSPAEPGDAKGPLLYLGRGRAAGVAEQDGGNRRGLALMVDQIVGPEEVVMRPLPPLLRHQQLISGVSLSGTGEIVLLFDSQPFMELVVSRGAVLGTSLQANTVQPIPQSSTTVLVVDDSLSARRVLARALNRRGFTVVEAVDGMEALERLRGGAFAAVFTDLDMPRLGGLELLREIKRHERSKAVPVVLVSSRDERQWRPRAAEWGAAAYLAKPVADSLLFDVLEELAGQSAGA